MGLETQLHMQILSQTASSRTPSPIHTSHSTSRELIALTRFTTARCTKGEKDHCFGGGCRQENPLPLTVDCLARQTK